MGQKHIAIVGAGMVGSSLAAMLQHTDCALTLIDRAFGRSEPGQGKTKRCTVADWEPRVSAITLASQRLFEQLGVWGAIQTGGVSAYQGMCVWDADGTGEITFDAAELHAPALGHIIENRVIADALAEHLELSGKADILPHRITDMQAVNNAWQLTLDDGSGLQADLVVGADGALSTVRKLAAIATREWDYQHHAIVTTVKAEQPHQKTAWQRFTEDGPLAFLPLADDSESDQFCSIVWSQKPGVAEELMSLDEQAFCSRLTAAFEGRLGTVESVAARYCIPLRQRHAKSYVKAGLALVGDAAHTIHPLAGQGVNLGLLDVMALAEEVERAISLGLSPGDYACLKRYQRRRMGDNLAMMGAMEGFKHLFGRDELPLRWLRNTGLKWVDQLSPLKNLIMESAMGADRQPPSFISR